MKETRAWLELITSLPTENATERMRAWRALKATGAAVLRDGVYMLPERPDLEKPADLPRKAVGFDFDGAQFTHVDNRVTFEVMLRSFALDGDAALLKLAEVVHDLDIGGLPVSDAPGIGTMLAGARQRSRDDDRFFKRAITIFDLIHAAYAEGDSR